MYVRPTTRRVYKKKTTAKSKYTRKSSIKRLPARGRFSKKRYYNNKKIGTMLNRYQENKLIALDRKSETPPTAIQTGAQATFVGYILGTVNTGFNGGTPVGGIAISQGVQENQRIGNYAFYKKTHACIRIEMNTGTNAPPIQFRFIVAKLRRYANPAGITPAWESSGFLEEDGTQFGHNSGSKTGLDLMMQPLNKRTWVIYRDQKFVLQPYNDLASSGTSIIYNNYPACKELMVNLPYYKKCFFDGGSALSPNDLEFRYIMVVYAHTLGRSGVVANSYECSIRGTTSFADC